MLSAFPFSFFMGSVLGFLAGLGVGGGSLLMIWLTLVLGIGQSTARLINLLFFIPSAMVSCFFRKKQGRLNLRNVLPGIVGGCISAAAFTFLGRQLELPILKKIFGALLLFTGIRELFYKPKTN